jgi:hypothetical protein
MPERRSAALFIALALVAAFLVSAIAGVEHTPSDHAADRIGGAVTGDPARSLSLAPDSALTAAPAIRIEVLNGAGRAGLARDATHRLRGHGFDVVFFGNAGRFDHTTSVVLARTGDLEGARAVAASLGIDSVAVDPDAALLLDATVILGADWPPPVPEPVPPLDRLRRLLAPADPGQ